MEIFLEKVPDFKKMGLLFIKVTPIRELPNTCIVNYTGKINFFEEDILIYIPQEEEGYLEISFTNDGPVEYRLGGALM